MIYNILGVVGSILWILYMLRVLGIGPGRALGSCGNMLKCKGKWIRPGKNTLAGSIGGVSDPREAAAALLIAYAEAGGPMTDSQRGTLEELCRARFGCNEAEAREIISAAAFHARQNSPEHISRHAAELLKNARGEEKTDVLNMMNQIVTEDRHTDIQKALFEDTRKKLNV